MNHRYVLIVSGGEIIPQQLYDITKYKFEIVGNIFENWNWFRESKAEIDKIIDKYIYSLREYAGSDKLNSLDDLIYYDEVIDDITDTFRQNPVFSYVTVAGIALVLIAGVVVTTIIIKRRREEA